MIRRAIIMLAFGFPSLVMAYSMSGRVLRVDNGNTVTIVDANNVQHTVKLQDVQAPDLGHPSGIQSQRSLQGMVGGRHVTIDYDPKTGYGAPTGRVYLGGEDINLKQVEQGMAKYRSSGLAGDKDKQTQQQYEAAQEQAKKKERGIWYVPSKRPGAPAYERRMMASNGPAKDAERNYPPLLDRQRFIYPVAPVADPRTGGGNGVQYVPQRKRTRAPYGHWAFEQNTAAPAPGPQAPQAHPVRPAFGPMVPYWIYPPYMRR